MDKKEKKAPAGTTPPEDRHQAVQAHRQADKDIASDPESAAPRKNDDLDEGELARLGDKKNDLA